MQRNNAVLRGDDGTRRASVHGYETRESVGTTGAVAMRRNPFS